jgi:hypothetical protein
MSTTALDVDSRERAPPSERGVLDLAQYTLEQVRRDAEFVLFRGLRMGHEKGSRSILVQVPVANPPSPATVRSLQEEYALRSELDPAYVVRSLSVVQDRGRPMAILEDPLGTPLDLLLNGAMDIADDLQWLDAATLDLLEDLLTGPEAARSDLQHLLLIGAYRANEVTSAHPLRQKLEAIEAAGGKVVEITLAPLTPVHLQQLISEALRCEADRAAPLARLVHEKTGGNPFFAHRFIASLADEGMLTFDHDAARWSWDLGRIQAKGYTDNLVDLMVGKLSRLTVETQEAVQELACLGNAAPIVTLALVCGTTETEIHSLLEEAVHADLLERRKDSYHFIHDRIQEAAYLLVPESLRPEAHLRIGRLLAANTPPAQREEAIYEIVNQLNRGATLMTSDYEREQLAELNLIAGKRTKASSAYGSALTYFTCGATLLLDDAWERRHELAFTLQLQRADCELWTGALPAAEKGLAALATRAVNNIERAAVASRRVDLYTMLGASDRAVEVGLEYLRHVNIDWIAHPTEPEARREYEQIWSHLGGRQIEDLIDLPLMEDQESLATLDVLTTLAPPALYTDENLWALTSGRAVNLSLERGNSDAAAAHYASVGLISAYRFGDYDAGYRLGKTACNLIERRDLTRFGAKVYALFALRALGPRCKCEASRSSGSSSRTTAGVGGELPRKLRGSCGACRRGDCTHRGSRCRCYGPVRASHPRGPCKRLGAKPGACLRTCGPLLWPARIRRVRKCLFAARAGWLSALGRRRQGAATAEVASRARRARIIVRSDKRYRGAGGAPRPRDRHQDFAGRLE